MSAALGLRSLALFIGAGWTGSYMYNNLTVERARSIAAQVLIRHKKDDNGSSSSSGNAEANSSGSSVGRSAVDALTSQVDRLTREVSRSRTQDSVVVVGGGNSGYRSVIGVVSDMFNLLGWAVFVCSAGGVLYFVFVRKGLSVKDLVWVSQTKFNETIKAMHSGMKRVTGAVSAVRKDLGERMLKMEGKVENVEANLSQQIEAEVGDVKHGVAKLGDEMSVVSRGVDTVHTRMEEMNHKIDGTHRGVQLLLDFVTSLAPEKVRPGTPFYNLKRYMQNDPGQIEDPNAIRPRLSHGLAGLLPSTNSSNGPSQTGENQNMPTTVTASSSSDHPTSHNSNPNEQPNLRHSRTDGPRNSSRKHSTSSSKRNSIDVTSSAWSTR